MNRKSSTARLLLEHLEQRNLPTVVPWSTLQRAHANDDWADTDGTTAVGVRVLANDTASKAVGRVHQAVPSLRTLHITSLPQHGHILGVNRKTGQIFYKANAGFSGTDSFRYTFNDTLGYHANQGTVSIRVNTPTASDDWQDTDGSSPVMVNVLANDTDPEGTQHIQGAGSVKLVSNPAHGTVSLNTSTNQVTYTASASFTGTDSFKYTVTDDHGATSLPATVFIRVNRPVAWDDLATFAGSLPQPVNVLDNDMDPEGNQHLQGIGIVTVVSNPAHGTAVVDPNTNQIIYTAEANFTGTDSFKYTVIDDHGGLSMPATVTMVGSFPGKPVNDDFRNTDGTSPRTVNVLANDTAPLGRQLAPQSVVVTFGPLHGHTTVNPQTGAITYTANAGFSGNDTFRYSVADDLGNPVGEGTVTVRVNNPTATDDWKDTDGTSPVTVAVLANDTDPEGSQHILFPGSVHLVSTPGHGSAVIDPVTNEVTYTASASFTGTDSFQYTVSDDNGGLSLPATVFIRVNRPAAADDSAVAHGQVPLAINVLANDADPEGNQHIQGPGRVMLVSSPAHGTVSLDPNTNLVTYTASAGFTGTDTFQYAAIDDHGGVSQPATVVVRVEAPTAANFTVVVAPSITRFRPALALSGGRAVGAVSLLSLASTPTPLGLFGAKFNVVSGPSHGTLTINQATGRFVYIGNSHFRGLDSFQYTITDKFGVVSKQATAKLIVRSNIPADVALLDFLFAHPRT